MRDNKLIPLAFLTVVALADTDAGRLVVCVHEGRGLADLDPPRYPSFAATYLGSGGASDAFVSLLVGERTFFTMAVSGSSSPVWNECFDLGGGFTESETLAFVVADVDPFGKDDVIGTACALASSGTVWLNITAPHRAQGTDADTPLEVARGQIRIQVIHFSDGAQAATYAHRHLKPQSAVSTVSRVPSPEHPEVEARVACPSSHVMVSCSCYGFGRPGCATARALRMAGSEVSQATHEHCVARSGALEPSRQLPPCESEDQEAEAELGMTACQPSSWAPLAASGVMASARCMSAGALHGVVNRASPLSLSQRIGGDAVAARCEEPELLLGCSVSRGRGEALGVRYEDLDSTDDVPGDERGENACVAYSGRGGVAVGALARCGRLDSATAYSAAMSHVETVVQRLGVPKMTKARTGRTHSSRNLDVSCPAGFVLSDCTCFSESSKCLGAAAAENGTDAFGLPAPVCRAALAHTGGAAGSAHVGASVFARCIWVGPSYLLRTAPSAQGLQGLHCPAEHSDAWRGGAGGNALSKPWLPPMWRERIQTYLSWRKYLVGEFEDAQVTVVGYVLTSYVLGMVSASCLYLCFHVCCRRCLAARRGHGFERLLERERKGAGAGPASESVAHLADRVDAVDERL